MKARNQDSSGWKQWATTICAITFGVMFFQRTTAADVRLPRIFANHMVLQQQTKNAMWGWADPGEAVNVKSSWGASAATSADQNGRWKLFLETPKFGSGHWVTVSGNNSVRFKDVAIGEVWLCAGQSNMGWSMGNSFEADSEAERSGADAGVPGTQRTNSASSARIQVSGV